MTPSKDSTQTPSTSNHTKPMVIIENALSGMIKAWFQPYPPEPLRIQLEESIKELLINWRELGGDYTTVRKIVNEAALGRLKSDVNHKMKVLGDTWEGN